MSEIESREKLLREAYRMLIEEDMTHWSNHHALVTMQAIAAELKREPTCTTA
jgi:hypothetical protein